MPIKEESQQPNAGRQHPIPQNVMDVEFKVVGDLTVRQLMYLFAGGAFAYVFWRSGFPAFWRVIVSGITVITSVGVAFFPYQERSLDKWLVSFLKAMTMPTQMVWRKSYSPPVYFLSDYANVIKNEILTLTPAKSRNKLDDYLGQLPENQTELDKLENSRLENIRSGFSTQLTSSVVLEQRSSQTFAPALGGSSSTTDTTLIEPEILTPPIVPVTTPIPTPPAQFDGKQTSQKKDFSQKTPPQKASPPPERKPQEPRPVQQTQQKQMPNQPQDRKAIMKDITENEMSSKKELLESIELKQPTLAAPSIDRAIVNIPSSMKGEIKIKTTTKLPKTIVVQDIQEIVTKESSLEKKVSELLQVTQQVRGEMQSAEDKKAHADQNRSRIEFFSTKYKELEKEQEKITTQLDESTSQVEQIGKAESPDLDKQVQDLSIKNEDLKDQLARIQSELAFLKSGGDHPIPENPPQKTQAPDQQNPKQNIPQATVQATPDPVGNGIPNSLTGVVKDKSGGLIENAVVIIKDKDGDAIRALKTNQLGQFKTQTPLQNGKYTVEIIKGGNRFDIIAVEAIGDPISPIYIVAKE